jgi:hypothetical protein
LREYVKKWRKQQYCISTILFYGVFIAIATVTSFSNQMYQENAEEIFVIVNP